MNNETYLQIQVTELRRLLDKSGDDPILVPQLRERLEDAEIELKEARYDPKSLFPKEAPVLPRAAIFLRGGGVEGSTGIRASLAGEALVNYDRMFSEQAMHDERIAAHNAGKKRRPRGTPTPSLLLIATPRGSFGMEFVPNCAGDETTLQLYAKALNHVAEAIELMVHSTEESLSACLDSIPAKVLKPLKKFLGTLAEHGAELRLAFHDKPARSLNMEEIHGAATRLNQEVLEVEEDVKGTIRGVTFDSGHFDFLSETGELITGFVDDSLCEDDLFQYNQLSNQCCQAKLLKTTIQKRTGAATSKYILLSLIELTEKSPAQRCIDLS